MITYNDIKTEVRGRLKDSASIMTDAYFNRWSKLLWADILTEVGGNWLYDEYTFATVSGTEEYALPSRFMSMIQMRDETNNRVIDQQMPEDEKNDPDRSGSGCPETYQKIYLRDVLAQPAASSAIDLVSTSASDTPSYSITIRGISGGVEKVEVVTMNGLTGVTSTNSYTEVYQIAKSTVFTGVVTATAGAVTLVTLAPEEIRRQHQWIRIFGSPDGAYTIRICFLRKPHQMVSTYDTFDAPEYMENAIVLGFEYYARKFFYESTATQTLAEYKDQLRKAARFNDHDRDFRLIHKTIEDDDVVPIGYISHRAP